MGTGHELGLKTPERNARYVGCRVALCSPPFGDDGLQLMSKSVDDFLLVHDFYRSSLQLVILNGRRAE